MPHREIWIDADFKPVNKMGVYMHQKNMRRKEFILTKDVNEDGSVEIFIKHQKE